ncbi:extracellular solute-binding protein [Mycetocola sp. 2940]|uniref:extracellular solute-binding protein n=1 Tax=Mycetocola sp. 2940 TaxID=3156452 RepID=UPI0033910A8D
MTEPFLGLTWDHPRGRRALEAASELWRDSGLDLTWHAQSLEGFESAPIAELAERYDLLVLDHPHLGDALASGCLRPMEEVVGEGVLAALSTRVVGPSLDSYRLGGFTWALPLDAATQVSACRPDLLTDVPETWDDVIRVSHEVPVALSLSGPHAYLTFASLCQSLGAPLATGASAAIVDESVGTEALQILSDITTRSPQGAASQNPIGLLERMTRTDEVAFIPLVYGYVGYADISRDRAVSFGPAPRGPEGHIGSTIGGTGIAVTARATVTDTLRRHLLWLLSDDVQTTFIPQNEGQPSLATAWESERVNASVGDFYRHTRGSIDRSWVRPRFEGFPATQARLSTAVRAGVVGGASAQDTLEQLTSIQNSAVKAAMGSRPRDNQGVGT